MRSPFQSTRPLRGGTPALLGLRNGRAISIHPPLAGRDLIFCSMLPPISISIHPPLAGRDLARLLDLVRLRISIHPPLAGRDTIAVIFPAYGAGFQSTRPLRGGTAILHKKTVQNIAYCTKSTFTLAVLSGFLALMRPFFLPNVHKFRCEPSEESLLAPRSHAYTIRTPSG